MKQAQAFAPQNQFEEGQKPVISLVAYFYNSQNLIKRYFDMIEEVFAKYKQYDYEIIAIEDGSEDKTFQILENYGQRVKNLKLIKLSRSFGKNIALAAALDVASGDGVIIFDPINSRNDLGDLKNDIRNIFRKKDDGEKIILFSQIEADKIVKIKDCAKLKNKIEDLMYFDRDILFCLKNFRENQNRNLKELVLWLGFKPHFLRSFTKFAKPIEPKKLPKSSCFSREMKILSLISLGLLLFSFGGISYIFIAKFFLKKAFSKYLAIIFGTSLLFSLNFWFLRIFLAKLEISFQESKKRPLYLIEKFIDAIPSK